jgi:hypothetical protein
VVGEREELSGGGAGGTETRTGGGAQAGRGEAELNWTTVSPPRIGLRLACGYRTAAASSSP